MSCLYIRSIAIIKNQTGFGNQSNQTVAYVVSLPSCDTFYVTCNSFEKPIKRKVNVPKVKWVQPTPPFYDPTLLKRLDGKRCEMFVAKSSTGIICHCQDTRTSLFCWCQACWLGQAREVCLPMTDRFCPHQGTGRLVHC